MRDLARGPEPTCQRHPTGRAADDKLTAARYDPRMHLIPSHRGRPADDPIFSLHREAAERRQRGEAVVDATIGVLLDDRGDLAILPTAARAVHEVPAVEWATYAPIAGTPAFLR